MRIIKYTHSCVRIERDGVVLVIDPGVWSEPGALVGADAVLVTHEHIDHIDELRLAGLAAPVYAPAGAAISRLPFTAVQPGDTFEAAGVRICALGGEHAAIVPDQQDTCRNLGYLVEDRVYHPGDSLTPPGVPVETLLLPMQASWLKTAEAIQYLHEVAPERAVGIHDAQVNERGRSSIASWLEKSGPFSWVPPRTSL